MNSYEVNGFYGHTRPTKTIVFVYANERTGAKWYVVKGSVNVNKTYEDIAPGTNVEELQDADCFTWSKPINTLTQLIKAVEA